jgi:hypothetical protein
MVAPTYFWKAGSFMLPIQYIALGMIYIAMLWILGEITKKDIETIASFRKKEIK